MSRAVRKPKTKAELQSMSLEQLNAELKYLRMREHASAPFVSAELFRKEISLVERIRMQRFGVVPRRT